MPSLVAQALKTGSVLDSEAVSKHLNCTCVDDVTCLFTKEKELARVAQWGTMVVFDYLTANYDRYVTHKTKIRTFIREEMPKQGGGDGDVGVFVGAAGEERGKEASWRACRRSIVACK